MEVISTSVERTRELGSLLGKKSHPGTVVVLVGDLGAGKTQFAKGVAHGLGVEDSRVVTSPTFVLMNQYEGKIPIQHYDLYRVEGVEIDALGFSDFRDSSVSLIEWGDKVGDVGDHIRVEFWVEDDTTRRLKFSARGGDPEQLLRDLNLFS